MLYSRRDLGKVALAGLPLVTRGATANRIDSKVGGVQIGAITWCFNSIARVDPGAIVGACAEIGLGEVELMSNHCEALAGAPAVSLPFNLAGNRPAVAGSVGITGGSSGARSGGGRGGSTQMPLTPEQQAARDEAQRKLSQWRRTTSVATWQSVRKKWEDAGIELALLCYNMRDSMTDDDIEYGFTMAHGLGVRGITTSTTLTMAKRIAPIANKHKLMVGYHGHDSTDDPNETATLESYSTLMSYGGYNGINLDVGHFTASGYDAVEFIKRYHARITNLHIKDRRKAHGPNVALWGTGDTPLRAVFALLKAEQYPFPANIELEYTIPQGSNLIQEMKVCYAYIRGCLA